ncbi:MAG: TlpA disulfide reductase family protein [Armatimonadota bacterium]
MKILRWVLPVALVYGAFAYGQKGPESFVGKTVPTFTSKTFDGKTVSNKTLKGKPYILDFWATWCGPCKAASPTMQAIHQKYASKGLVVIGADILEESGGLAIAKKYPKEHKYTYTFTTGNEPLGEKLGITGIPCILFVDKNGKVIAVRTGFKKDSPTDFDNLAKSLL